MKKQSILILLFSIPFLGISQLYTPGAGVTDIDGNTYQTIIINGQEWMSENLRTNTYANGDQIPNVTESTPWSSLTTGAWAHYNNDNQYENIYGKLYNWYTTADPRNVCPTGWHIPTDLEFTQLLVHYLDPSSVGNQYSYIAGGKLKKAGTQNWECPNSDATNESGFSALAGGYRGGNGLFNGVGEDGSIWTSTEFNNGAIPLTDAYFRSLSCYGASTYNALFPKKTGRVLRCMKNNSVGLNNILPANKYVIKVFDIMGNESIEKPNELLFYLYNDGSVEKKIIIEK
jgi:uncharacterized protein (TIGR02145 family)